ncbi:MAG TPA: Gfo/Idh/MocA family oxidoreductase [Pyrinomonadaceae bacterium]|jgi:myo-inositol 2-dehydrogenase/D-chiro-inositol 1-dehydrogenase|nr:Gfo/Idh/MocA family oxidoreductase [Pyrinomonadaceae bacterium]
MTDNNARAVRLGLVGCGRVTEIRHLPALREVPGIEVCALADVDAARLASVGERFGVARRCGDYRELIEAGDVDAVAVCVPPRFHTEVALAALAAGKHVMIEKPLALELAECELLAARAALAPTLKVLVGFNLRWHRLVREARAIVGRGELGEIKLVRTVLTSGVRRGADFSGWRKERETGGGALFELGVHHFDVIRFLLGDEVAEVSASSRAPDETATVAARMRGGAQVLSAFCEGTGENHGIEIYGARGWLRLSCYRADGLERFDAAQYEGAFGARLRKLGQTLAQLPSMIRRSRRGGDYVASYASEWRHFADAIREDTTVEATLADGTRALEIALAAWESAAHGRTVKLAGTERGDDGGAESRDEDTEAHTADAEGDAADAGGRAKEASARSLVARN